MPAQSDPAPDRRGSGRGWEEAYLGGSPEAEARLFRQMASDITGVQDRWRARTGTPRASRPFHAKTLAAVTNAELQIRPDIAADLRVGPLQPGANYPATVRFSNAHASIRSDRKPDLRGVAIRLHVDDTRQDLLLTNAPASHARDARQFMAAANASALGGVRGVVALLRALGVREALRMAVVVASGQSRPVHSLSSESFWSRAAIAVGPVAVRLKLQPEGKTEQRRLATGPDHLSHDFARRLRRNDIVFVLHAQRYVDAVRTPIEDGAARWHERDAPFEPLARLTIPRQDLESAQAKTTTQAVEELAFTPWNTTEGLRPLGNLNRVRDPVYAASAGHRRAVKD